MEMQFLYEFFAITSGLSTSRGATIVVAVFSAGLIIAVLLMDQYTCVEGEIRVLIQVGDGL